MKTKPEFRVYALSLAKKEGFETTHFCGIYKDFEVYTAGHKVPGPPHYTFFITFSRHPSCLSQSICFPEIDRFFAFVNSEKSAWTDGKNEPKPCGENMKVFLERNF